MCSIFYLQNFGQPQHAELIFHGVDPFFHVKWLCCFLENRWPSIYEVLEVAVLVHPMATTLIITSLSIFGDGTQKIFYVLLRLLNIALAPKKLREEYLCSEQWRRWQLWLWL
jgi:hypothetical protein